MLKSMTGFGRGEVQTESLKVSCEIKTVNSKYLDVSLKLPQKLLQLEPKVKRILAEENITRGKADIRFEFESTDEKRTSVEVNAELAEEYLSALRSLAESLGESTEFTLRDVISKPDVIKVGEKDRDDEEPGEDAAEAALRLAARELLSMRENEGRRLAEDFLSRLDFLENAADRIDSLSDRSKSGYFERLKVRLKSLLDEEGIESDDARILTECAIFADKIAVDEETVRLRSHIEAFKDFMKNEDAVGRRLDFLTQELNREVNTIGSKCQDAEIAHLVVDMKNEIEKIREQVQNIE